MRYLHNRTMSPHCPATLIGRNISLKEPNLPAAGALRSQRPPQRPLLAPKYYFDGIPPFSSPFPAPPTAASGGPKFDPAGVGETSIVLPTDTEDDGLLVKYTHPISTMPANTTSQRNTLLFIRYSPPVMYICPQLYWLRSFPA